MKLKQFLIEATGREKCEEIFGRFLFGEYKKFYKTIKEPDTKVEKLAFDSVVRWVESAGMRQSIGKNLNILFQCKEKYTKILGQTTDTFYRVFTLPDNSKYGNDILKFEYKIFQSEGNAKDSGAKMKLKENPEIIKFWTKNKKEFLKYCNVDFEYKPQYKLESWSSKKTSAYNFAMKAMHVPTGRAYKRNGVTFIVKSNLPKDELLFSPKFMNMIAKDAGWWPQNEVMRLSKGKNIIKTKIFYLPLLKNISQDFQVPDKIKKEIVTEIKNKWSQF